MIILVCSSLEFVILKYDYVVELWEDELVFNIRGYFFFLLKF